MLRERGFLRPPSAGVHRHHGSMASRWRDQVSTSPAVSCTRRCSPRRSCEVAGLLCGRLFGKQIEAPVLDGLVVEAILVPASALGVDAPGATAATHVAKATDATESEELLLLEESIVGEGTRVSPNLVQALFLQVVFDEPVLAVHRRGQGQTALHVPAAFDPDDLAAGPTTEPEWQRNVG